MVGQISLERCPESTHLTLVSFLVDVRVHVIAQIPSAVGSVLTSRTVERYHATIGSHIVTRCGLHLNFLRWFHYYQQQIADCKNQV